MGAKNGMETGHLKSHIEAGRLALLQEMASKALVVSGNSSGNNSLHPPVLNFLRKSLTAPFEVGPVDALIENITDEQKKQGGNHNWKVD